MKFIFFFFVVSFATLVGNAQSKDPFPEVRYFGKFTAKFPLDEKPSVIADTDLIAIWKMKEGVDPHDYFVVERYQINEFVFTYMNRGGSNRTYENVSAFFSKIGNVDFLTVCLYDQETNTPGFFFLKVIDRDNRGWHMSLSLVADTTLKELTSSNAVRARIEKNITNPKYFMKPVHFDKKLPLMYCK